MNVAGALGFAGRRPLWLAVFSSNESAEFSLKAVLSIWPLAPSIAVTLNRRPCVPLPLTVRLAAPRSAEDSPASWGAALGSQ